MPGIFLDTGNIEEIRKYHQMGIIRGVTTNPTILLRQGITGGVEAIKKCTTDIAEYIDPLPLSIEVTTNDVRDMISEAKLMATWGPNINVKVTIHGPNGETENLKVIHELENDYDVRVNVTAMMSAQQCLLAAMAGATYVSLFGGRVNNMGYNTNNEIRILRDLLDQFGLPSEIIVGSTREILNIVEWLHAGAHIVTATPDLLNGMIVHPYSKETVRMFLEDAKKVNEK